MRFTHVGGCKIRPSPHLLQRMSDDERGFSPKEVYAAIAKGQKRTVAPNKYIGKSGHCQVVVYKGKCNLRVATVEEPSGFW